MKQPTIKLEFTFDQLNSVLGALGKSPAEMSMNPIMLIQHQAGPQVEAIRVEEAKAVAKAAEEKKDEQ
jgi:hypothetical protein